MSNFSCNGELAKGRRELYVIQGETAQARVAELRRCFLGLAADAEIKIHFVPSFDMGSLGQSAVAKTIVTTDPRSITAAQCLNKNDVLIFFTIPPSYPNEGKDFREWAQSIRDVADYQSIIFTNSSFSRRIVESVLQSFRADVRVLVTPEACARVNVLREASTGGERPLKWQFDVASELRPEGRFSYGGVSWSGEEEDIIDVSAQGDEFPASISDKDEFFHENRLAVFDAIAGHGTDLTGLKVGVIGTKLSFIDELVRDLERYSGAEVTQDAWKYLSGPPSVAKTLKILEQSDVVIGEWARPNNVWIQERVDDATRLIVRAHRYEVTTDFPRQIDMQRYSAGVVIVPWVGRKLVQEFGWPEGKMVYIPNYINSQYFDRPKLPGARYTLGIVGITPSLKRLDLALELLSRLRKEDARYSLRVRGALPPSHINWGRDPEIEAQWSSILYRLENDEWLAGAVHFDSAGRDMGAWLEQIGVILSTSDLEGSHVALAEGIASGALPVVRDWPGARTLWPSEIIHPTIDSAVSWVLQARDREWFEHTTKRLKRQKSLDGRLVLEAWADLLRGDLSAAKERFGPIDWGTDLYEPIDLDCF